MAQQPRAGGILEPVRQSIRVRRTIQSAFDLFTRDIGTWWPVETHRIGDGAVAEVVFEGRPGGRIYHVDQGGRATDWGRVLVWEPPHRVVFTWRGTLMHGGETEVEVRFFADGDAATRVELEHRGWERLGGAAETARSSYLNGWPYVFGRRFAGAAGEA